MLIDPVVVRLRLPASEDFGDAYDGKCYVRIPVDTRPSPLPPPKPVRLRREAPLIHDSLWLPDHCVHTANILEIERRRWKKPWSSAAHRGIGSRVVA